MRDSGPATRFGLVLAVLAAVALRLLTPAGWMPSPKGFDGSLFVICSAEGPHLAGKTEAPQKIPAAPAKSHDLCVFSGYVATGAPDVPSFAAPRPALLDPAGPTVVADAPWSPHSQYRQQAPRGPPALI